jgi:ferredoxin-type protein NapF
MAGALPKQARLRRGRTILRWTILVVLTGLAWPGRPEGWFGTSVVLPALSPVVALGGSLAARSLNLLATLALPVLVLAWIFPRALCGYGCPIGLLQETVARLRPCPRRPWLRLPALGAWLAAATLAGAGLGYPIFLWLDPLAIFNSGLNAWRLPLTLASLAAGLGLPALLLLELAWPQFWCRRLCPLGAVQDALTQSRRRLTRPPGIDTPTRELPGAVAARTARGRRTFLAACAGAAGAVAIKPIRGATPPLRPPGALDESSFTGVCVRCGNCAQACPSHIIQPDLGGDLAGWLAPRLSFVDDYCRENCHRCHQVCPSGAIARLSLAEKRRAVIGSARVDLDTCLMALGRECNACVQICPYEAITIESGRDGFSSQPRVDFGRCNGCGACEPACPVRPRRAIRVGMPQGVVRLPE